MYNNSVISKGEIGLVFAQEKKRNFSSREHYGVEKSILEKIALIRSLRQTIRFLEKFSEETWGQIASFFPPLKVERAPAVIRRIDRTRESRKRTRYVVDRNKSLRKIVDIRLGTACVYRLFIESRV